MFITSDRIELSPVDLSSINESWIETLNDREYMKFSQYRFQSWRLKSQTQYLNQFDQFKSWCLKITNLQDKYFVGTVSVYFNFISGTVSLEFLIFKEFQGQNYASDTLTLISGYLSEYFPNFKIEIGTHASNLAMIKVIEKQGFKLSCHHTKDQFIEYYKITDCFNELTTPKIPPIISWAKKICLVANDAGGAEQLKWLLASIHPHPATFLQGPAVNIFEKSSLDYQKLETKEQLSSFDLVLAGSGWMSNFENSIIDFCAQKKIPCIVLLDHWVNYKVRFQTLAISTLRLLAVTNSMALSLAKQTYNNSTIWIIPDFQIIQYKKLLDGLFDKEMILVILEPESKFQYSNEINKEMVFDLIEKSLTLNISRGYRGLIVRLHPSQSLLDNDIIELKEHFKGINFSTNKELIDDLSICSLVVGFSSYALYIAAMCGKETKSYFKSNIKHWTNSITEIESL